MTIDADVRQAVEHITGEGDASWFSARDVMTFCRSLGGFYTRPELDEVLQAMARAGGLETQNVVWTGGDGFLHAMTMHLYRMVHERPSYCAPQ